ncbi:nitroreductase family protein [Fulvivirga ligni]|uniref:nitroreductase family protein n=1 Tax=Fulvivirga ligni TaxID=2904246 RepID=UPI001F1E56C7|nr:nitroreductase family protein [Fulvivirga ligni]UII22658.1 nitroreductase family protein [Fulvivirga ligni]
MLRKYTPNIIISILRKVKVSLIAYKNYSYDASRYLKYSAFIKRHDNYSFEELLGRITALYHVLEKGIVMVNRKTGFGKDRVLLLCEYLDKYNRAGFDNENSQYQAALRTLRTYVRIHEEENIDLDWLETKSLVKLFQRISENKSFNTTGFLLKKGEDIRQAAKGDFASLVYSRHSIRNFSESKVDIDRIESAIRFAQQSPSVCNRQSSKVYILQKKDLVQKALNCQTGNRGFGHLVDTLLIVTSSLQYFNSIGERNQSFIDGGMFSMSLLYALHYCELGACPLNWSTDRQADLALRNVIDIDDEDNIIMMIAVGNIPSELMVASSARKQLKEIIKVL